MRVTVPFTAFLFLLVASAATSTAAAQSTGDALPAGPPSAREYTAAELLAWEKEKLPDRVWRTKVAGLQRHLDAGGRVPPYFLKRMREWRRARAGAQGRPLPARHPNASAEPASPENPSPVSRDSSVAEVPARRPAPSAAPKRIESTTTHRVPFASEGNRIELTLTGAPASVGKVRAMTVPSWLDLKSSTQPVEAGEEAPVTFHFDVKETAPVGAPADLVFAIERGGRVAVEKEIRLEVEAPAAFSLSGNYPNPFREQTKIGYRLPEAADVTISVYDARGRRVKRLREGRKAAGSHVARLDASNLSSGVYFYRIRVETEGGEERQETGRMVLVR